MSSTHVDPFWRPYFVVPGFNRKERGAWAAHFGAEVLRTQHEDLDFHLWLGT